MTKGAWVSESRVGWNKTYLARLDAFLEHDWRRTRRRRSCRTAAGGQLRYQRRVRHTADAEIWDMAGTTYSFEQKFSRGFQRHLVKAGFRFMRETGGRLNPEIPSSSITPMPMCSRTFRRSRTRRTALRRTASHMDNYSAFIQDDWRFGSRFVLNLGLRYDYYGIVHVKPTTDCRCRDRQLRASDRFQQAGFWPAPRSAQAVRPRHDELRPHERDLRGR